MARSAREVSTTLENEAIATLEAEATRQIGWVISMEDWALIRRLVADGVPQRQVARDLGIGRSTVARAVASLRPPKYERKPVVTSFRTVRATGARDAGRASGHAGHGGH